MVDHVTRAVRTWPVFNVARAHRRCCRCAGGCPRRPDRGDHRSDGCRAGTGAAVRRIAEVAGRHPLYIHAPVRSIRALAQVTAAHDHSAGRRWARCWPRPTRPRRRPRTPRRLRPWRCSMRRASAQRCPPVDSDWTISVCSWARRCCRLGVGQPGWPNRGQEFDPRAPAV